MQAEIYRPGEFAGGDWGDWKDLIDMDELVDEAVGVVVALKRALEMPPGGHVKLAALQAAEVFLMRFAPVVEEGHEHHPAG